MAKTTEDISLSGIKATPKDVKETVTDYAEAVVNNEEHLEGPMAKAIEEQTAKLPSDTFLWAAVGAMAVSATLQVAGKQKTSLFFGQWVAPLLLFGVYNKIVKVAGSDKKTK